MSVFRGRHRPPAQVQRSGSFSLSQLGIMMQAAEASLGITSIDEALRNAADWACIRVKAQGLASMPVDVVRYVGKARQPMPAPPVITSPSGIVTRRVWTFQAAVSMFSDGNVFGKVTDIDTAARPSQIELLNPDKVSDRKVVDGVPQVRVSGEMMRRYPWGDLWHVPGEMVVAGSPFGLSPVWYGSKSTATSLAAEAFGGQFFTDGGHPTGLIKPKDGVDPGEEGAKAMKGAFMAVMRGSREPIVTSDFDYEQLQINPNDSQFLELMQFEIQQACRRHGVPPSMVYAQISGQNVNYQNVTQADMHYLKHTLSYPTTLFEEALSALLPAPRVVKYNRDAILAADAETRHKVYGMRLEQRTISVNAVKALEDEEGYGPEFDVPGIPPMSTDVDSPDEDNTDDEGGAE